MASSGSTLSLTMHRAFGNTKHRCSTKTIKILPEKRNFYIFIQTDKPIYKPGDEVKFRILVIDSDMKPFHMNSLKLDIIDPFGRIIETFSNLEVQYLGLFEDIFKLSSRTVLGDWNIQAVVDNKEQYKTAKTFGVQKYILPLFEVHVETNEKHYLLDHDINFIFYAKYSFGEFVTGNAELVIRNQATGYEYFRNLFRNVEVVETFSKNIKYHLHIDTSDVVALEALVIFTEPGSGLSFNKSTVFNAHNGNKYKVTPFHPSKFSFGSNFKVTVHVTEWNGEKFKNSNEKVEMKFSFTTSDFNNLGKLVHMPIIDGVASYDIEVPMKAELLHLEVKFTNSRTYVESEIYRARIEPGSVGGGISALNVDHEPKKYVKIRVKSDLGGLLQIILIKIIQNSTFSPRLNDRVKISIKTDSKLKNILSIITNKLGNIQSEVISCNNNANCEFYITINENMMPSSTVTVYNVVDKSHIYYGSTRIGTDVFKEDNVS